MNGGQNEIERKKKLALDIIDAINMLKANNQKPDRQPVGSENADELQVILDALKAQIPQHLRSGKTEVGQDDYVENQEKTHNEQNDAVINYMVSLITDICFRHQIPVELPSNKTAENVREHLEELKKRFGEK